MLRTLAASLLSLVAHRLAFLLPRTEDVWVFGCRGGERFEGNAKYLFLHVAARDDLDVRPVWISERAATIAELRRRGYEAYRPDSRRGLATMLRAKHVFVTGSFTDLPLWPTGGATVVQLWHGVPLKTISLDGAWYDDASRTTRLRSRYVYRQFDRVTATGKRFERVFASAFGISPDRVVATGYPRNDALFRTVEGYDIGQDRALYADIAAIEGPTLAYLPTYRDDGRPAADAIDFRALDDFLGTRDATMLVKFHPNEQPNVDGDAFDNVQLLPEGFDIYPVLRYVDALVTDYSSIYFDYLLLDRPTVFYAYDLERYGADRGFYLDYEAATPGPIATDFDELLAALDRCLGGADSGADAREAVRAAVFDQTGGNAAARVVQAVTDVPPPTVDERALPDERASGDEPERRARHPSR